LLLLLSVFFVRGAQISKQDSINIVNGNKKIVVDRWIAPDKGLHLLGSMMTTIAVTKTLQQHADFRKASGMKWAVGFSFSLGIGKELWDSTKPRNFFSWKDLCADLVGITLGRLILELE